MDKVATSKAKPARVIIIVEGGVVQSVMGTDSDIDVTVLDWDNVKEGDVESEEAYLKRRKEAEDLAIEADTMFHLL